MSELEQLRDENRRLRDVCRTLIGARSGPGWVIGNVDLAARLAEEALAQPAPAPAEGQQPEPASDGEVERLRQPIHVKRGDMEIKLDPSRRDVCEAHIGRLLEVIAQLPKTADGVPITPGMLVYHPLAGKVEVRRVGGDLYCVPESSTVTVTDWCWYSTREAALAASKGEVQK